MWQRVKFSRTLCPQLLECVVWFAGVGHRDNRVGIFLFISNQSLQLDSLERKNQTGEQEEFSRGVWGPDLKVLRGLLKKWIHLVVPFG